MECDTLDFVGLGDVLTEICRHTHANVISIVSRSEIETKGIAPLSLQLVWASGQVTPLLSNSVAESYVY